jgi:hypothetical protein
MIRIRPFMGELEVIAPTHTGNVVWCPQLFEGAGCAAVFQRSNYGFQMNCWTVPSAVLAGCSFLNDGRASSFLKDGRADCHSAVQRIPRSHSSASLKSKSASALTLVARANLRYRTARLDGISVPKPNKRRRDASFENRFGSINRERQAHSPAHAARSPAATAVL